MRANAAVSTALGVTAVKASALLTTRDTLPRERLRGIGHKRGGGAGAGSAATRYTSTGYGAREVRPFFNQPFELKPMQPGVASQIEDSWLTMVVFATGKIVSFVLMTSEDGKYR